MKSIVLAASLALGLFSFGAFAESNIKDYNLESVKADRAAGKAVVVDVYADWCPTCKKQKGDLEAFANKNKETTVLYKLNFDNKDHVTEFTKYVGKAIPRQSTVVTFKGDKLIDVSVAESGKKLNARLAKLQ